MNYTPNMNYTPLEDAYKIHHVKPTTYGGIIKYITTCIYCKHPASTALMTTDGGSFRQCERCKKQFRATIMNEAISNFGSSTQHLKGTN